MRLTHGCGNNGVEQVMLAGQEPVGVDAGV